MKGTNAQRAKECCWACTSEKTQIQQGPCTCHTTTPSALKVKWAHQSPLVKKQFPFFQQKNQPLHNNTISYYMLYIRL